MLFTALRPSLFLTMHSFSLFAAALSGFLLGITTIGNGPVYHLHWAIFFGFVPLWAAWLRERSARAVFLSGWVCQFTFTLIAFHWISYTVNEFSHIGRVASTLVLLLYCSVANLQFPLAGLLWHRFFRRQDHSLPAQVAALALLTALCERLGTMIFHWNFGYAWLYMGWPGTQLAEFAGFRWLCTFSICMNGFFLLAWKRRSYPGWWKPLAIAAAAFGLINLLGWARLKSLPPPDRVAKVLLVQPNIGNRDKEKIDEGEEKFRATILRRYMAQTEAALRELRALPDFALWPENAFPFILGEPDLVVGPLARELKAFITKHHLPLVTGGFGLHETSDQTTNSMFSIDAQGRWQSEPYHKIYLLPFGEYVPLSSRLPFLKSWFPDVRDYAAGEKPRLLASGEIRIGPQICYEGLFDSVSRDLAKLGAEIIVNITNDSWYGDWMEPWQHFYITMAKAIETRRPLVRGTNTGLSAVIHADGTIPEISPISKEWSRLFEVPYRRNPSPTIFMRWGYWIDWVFLAGGLLGVALSQRRRRRGSSDGAEAGGGVGAE